METEDIKNNLLRDVKLPEETGADLTNFIAALEQSPELVSILLKVLKLYL